MRPERERDPIGGRLLRGIAREHMQPGAQRRVALAGTDGAEHPEKGVIRRHQVARCESASRPAGLEANASARPPQIEIATAIGQVERVVSDRQTIAPLQRRRSVVLHRAAATVGADREGQAAVLLGLHGEP